MKNYKVRFVNFELGSVAMAGDIKGHSGKSYLQCRRRNGRQESELVSLERYGEIIRDISRAWHLPMRKWVPMFVEVEDGAGGDAVADGTHRSYRTYKTHAADAADTSGDLDKLSFAELRRLATARRMEKKLTLNTGRLKRAELVAFLKAA